MKWTEQQMIDALTQSGRYKAAAALAEEAGLEAPPEAQPKVDERQEDAGTPAQAIRDVLRRAAPTQEEEA